MSTQPISAARMAANKANAQKSTGPKTPEGKAAVAGNALKHGLRSERNPLDLASDTALPFEREEFEATLAAFLDDLQPHGPLETRLVERLAQIDLRLNRAVRMETTHLDISARRVHKASANALPDDEPSRSAWLTTLAFLHDPAALKLIGQYETRLSRDFARTLSQLRQSQALRIRGQVQNLRIQTQPATKPNTQATPNPTAMPTRLASDGQVATTNTAPPESTQRTTEKLRKQTQQPAESNEAVSTQTLAANPHSSAANNS